MSTNQNTIVYIFLDKQNHQQSAQEVEETYEGVRIELFDSSGCGHYWTAILLMTVVARTVVVAAAGGLPLLPGHVLE